VRLCYPAGELGLRRAPWTGAFLDELCAFPLGDYGDQVDALSGAFEQLLVNARGTPE